MLGARRSAARRAELPHARAALGPWALDGRGRCSSALTFAYFDHGEMYHSDLEREDSLPLLLPGCPVAPFVVFRTSRWRTLEASLMC